MVVSLGVSLQGPSVSWSDDVQDFTLPSATDGSLIRPSDYPGQVILINWWRTSCGYSQRESPRLVQLYEKYRNQGLVILGVSDDDAETVAQVPDYLKRYGIPWAVGLNDQGEFTREIVRPRTDGSTPANYLITRSGQLTYLGLDRTPEDWQKLEEAVARALEEPPTAPQTTMTRELSPAHAFSLPNLSGETVSLSDFAGKPLVVNFFTASTCDWAGPVLSKLHQDLAGRGLQMVGIDLYDDDAAIQGCIQRHQVRYPILRGDQATQQAWIGSSSGWATFFVTSDGKTAKRILDSVENGLEDLVFLKYAEHLLGSW